MNALGAPNTPTHETTERLTRPCKSQQSAPEALVVNVTGIDRFPALTSCLEVPLEHATRLKGAKRAMSSKRVNSK